MGTITDLIDLVNQLTSSVKDRKFAGELRQVQSMIGAIQSEHAEIHEQRINLLTKNAELKQNIASLKEEIVDLKSQMGTIQSVPQADNALSEEEKEILLLLSEAEDATTHQIAQSMNQKLTKTKFWIRRLYDLNMVSSSLIMNQPTSYYLIQGGREYLVKNNLI